MRVTRRSPSQRFMATTKTQRVAFPLTSISLIIAVALAYVLYVSATERHHATHFTTQEGRHTPITRAHQRQLSRLHTRIRAIKYASSSNPGEGCFATTEDQAREKLIQSIREAEPGSWDPTTDFSNWLPSAGNFVCTEGLRQDEVDGISAALNAHTQVKPRLALNVHVENAPETDEAHGIIETYLGRERYREHVAACLERKQSDSRGTNATLHKTMTELLHLSREQQEAIQPLQERLRILAFAPIMQGLDERGELVDLNEQPERDMVEDLRELLSIAERGFSILTEEQARAYREFATGNAYSEVLSQYKLTELFLPIPEQIREMIKSNEVMIRLNQAEDAQGQETPGNGTE